VRSTNGIRTTARAGRGKVAGILSDSTMYMWVENCCTWVVCSNSPHCTVSRNGKEATEYAPTVPGNLTGLASTFCCNNTANNAARSTASSRKLGPDLRGAGYLPVAAARAATLVPLEPEESLPESGWTVFPVSAASQAHRIQRSTRHLQSLAGLRMQTPKNLCLVPSPDSPFNRLFASAYAPYNQYVRLSRQAGRSYSRRATRRQSLDAA
jgi:hypothetical protein